MGVGAAIDSGREGPRPGAVLAGLALVGAAAGYALLALRFKNLNAGDRGRFAAGSAEMKAAESITRTFVSSQGVSGAASEQMRQRLRDEERRRVQQEARERAARTQAAASDHELQWATQALGLPGLLTLTRPKLKEAYREQAKRFHPDQNKDPSAAASFRRVSQAYEALAQALPKG